MSDLDQILSGEQSPEPTEPVQTEETVVETEDTPTEEVTEPVEAPVEEPVAAEPEPKQEDAKPEPAMVPVAALQEVRQQLREMRALVEKQEKPEPPKAPDLIDDPEGYRTHMETQVESRVSSAVNSTKLEMSRFFADEKYGKEAVDAAVAYFNDHPDESQALLKEASPFHAAVEYVNRQRVASEIGNDPAAYRERLEQEIRAKVEAEMVAKQARDKAGKFAPSLAGVTGTGGGPKTPEWRPSDLSKLIGD